jgi:hypothetical protein
MASVAHAIEFVDSASRGVMGARGYSEALQARFFGGWASAAIAAGLSLAFALGAAGQKDTNRRWPIAGVGAFFGIMLVSLAGYALFAQTSTASALMVAACAAYALVSLPVALGASGTDARHNRAAALSVASAAAMLLAWVAANTAAISLSRADQFNALSNVMASDRGVVAAHGASSILVLSRVHWAGMGVLVVVVLVCVGWAASRGKPTLGGVVGGALVASFLALAFGVSASVTSHTESLVMSFNEAPWRALAGFSPVVLPPSATEGVDGAASILSADGLVFQEARVSADELETTAGQAHAIELFRAQQVAVAAERSQFGEEPIEWLLEEEAPADPDDTNVGVLTDPRLSIFLDAGVGVNALRSVLRAAQGAGMHALQLCGATPQPALPGGLDSLTAAVAGVSPVCVTVLLESALPAGFAAADPALWHTTVGANTAGSFSARASLPGQAVSYPQEEGVDMPEPPGSEGAIAYLRMTGEATPSSIVAAAVGAETLQFSPLLCAGALPDDPDRRIEETPSPEETLAEQPSAGGSLAREVIRSVIRSHMMEVRACFERGLAANPELAGRVTVSFVISASGAVQSSTIANTTLNHAQVEGCVTDAVRSWTFPAPEGGAVLVNYPFVLD